MARKVAVLIALHLLGRSNAERAVCQVASSLADSVDAHLDEWDTQIEAGLDEKLNCSEFLEFVYLSRDRIRTELDYTRGNFTAEDQMFSARGDQGLSTPYAMTHMSKAASLVSAHVHIHGVLAAGRPDCLSEQLQLLFLMSLRRLKSLLHTQLRHLWVVFQGTSELFRQGVARWLEEVMELFDADARTFESVMSSWRPPESELRAALEQGHMEARHHWAMIGDPAKESAGQWGDRKGAECLLDGATTGSVSNRFGNAVSVTCCDSRGLGSRPDCLSGVNHQAATDHCERLGLSLCTRSQIEAGAGSGQGCSFDGHAVWTGDACLPKFGSEEQSRQRPGPPLPSFERREDDGVALSTVEILRRDAFDEWEVPKPLLRALLRYVLPRDAHVADLCAGTGQAAEFLNSTGLVTVYAFDASSNIALLSKGAVESLRPYAEPIRLWRMFDVMLCLSSAELFGEDANRWDQVWRNIDAHTAHGVVLSCGNEEVRWQVLRAAARSAPKLLLDEQLSSQLSGALGGSDSTCIFWRSPS